MMPTPNPLLIIHSVTALPVARTSEARADADPVTAVLIVALAVAAIATIEAIRHHLSKTARRQPPAPIARPHVILPTPNLERTPHDTAYPAVLVARR